MNNSFQEYNSWDKENPKPFGQFHTVFGLSLPIES